MVSDECQMKAAYISRDAASEMTRAASTIDEAVRQFQFLLADGYGGNGLCLLEELRDLKTRAQTESAAPQETQAVNRGPIPKEGATPASAADLPEAKSPEPAIAWLITRESGATELVMSPLTDDTYMSEGDEAIPLYASPQADRTEAGRGGKQG